eukprot:263786-Hanusia_phi.AAC.1
MDAWAPARGFKSFRMVEGLQPGSFSCSSASVSSTPAEQSRTGHETWAILVPSSTDLKSGASGGSA